MIANIPVKIYLDQNHLSRIVKGLRGNKDCERHVHLYRLLLDLKRDGKVIIYYSWCHIYEILKYEGDKEFIVVYCDVLDSLTNGNCIIFPSNIYILELKRFLSLRLGLGSLLNEKDCVYGKKSEAALPEIESMSGFLNEAFKKAALGNPILYMVVSNKQIMRQIFNKMSDVDVANFISPIVAQFPFLKNVIKAKADILTMVCGEEAERKAFTRKLYDEIFSIRNLALYFKERSPEIRNLGSLFDGEITKLSTEFDKVHLLYDMKKENLINENLIQDALIDRLCNFFDEEIKKLSNRGRFDYLKAKKLLSESRLRDMPSLNVSVILSIEYFKRHKGGSATARCPVDSDTLDLYHAINIPYVDFYLTEKFFAEVAKKISTIYSTKIISNVEDLINNVN